MTQSMTAGSPAALAHGFSREAVETLSALLREPDWLRERRREAWEAYKRIPMPAVNQEDWRRTDISPLRLEELAPFAGGPDRVDSLQGLPAALRGQMAETGAADLLVQVDARPAYVSLSRELAEQGVRFAPLEQAAREQPELVAPHFMREAVPPSAGKFAALHGALWSGGSFLYVPEGVEVAQPLHSSYWLTRSGVAVFPHTLIVLEAGASAIFIEEYLSETQEGDALAAPAVEVFLGDGAQLRYIGLQRWGANVWNLGHQHFLAGAAASLEILSVAMGSRVTKAYLNTTFRGRGAHGQLLGLVVGDGDQHIDFQTVQDHLGPHTESNLDFKAAMMGRARMVWLGLVRILPGAQRSNAYQSSRNILLSEHAAAFPIPSLEIEANDVRCTHGTTIGQVDAEQIYYLQTRGLSQREAGKVIVGGFFQPMIQRVPVPGVQDLLHRLVDQRLTYSG